MLVQRILEKRKDDGRAALSLSPYSGRIYCGDCGGLFGSKVWGSNTKYRRIVWKCNARTERSTMCEVPHLTENQIQTAFLAAFNCLITNKSAILRSYNEIIRILTDTSALDAEAATLNDEIEVLEGMAKKCIEENATTAIEQSAYQERFNALLARDNAAKERLKEIEEKKLDRTAKRGAISAILQMLKKHDDIVTEFSDELWYMTVEKMLVQKDGRIDVHFRDGGEVGIPRNVWKGKQRG
jgi:regulator of replication initiation timing